MPEAHLKLNGMVRGWDLKSDYVHAENIEKERLLGHLYNIRKMLVLFLIYP